MGGSILETACPPKAPNEGRTNPIDQEQGPAHGTQQSPQSGQARGVIDESDTEGQQDPASHVVHDAGGQNGDTNVRTQQVELCQDATENWESGDGQGRADEESVDAEIDLDSVCVVTELVVQAIGNSDAEGKRHGHAGQTNG